MVPTEEILRQDANLSIARYVKRNGNGNGDGDDGDSPDLASVWSAFEKQGREFWPQMDSLVEMLDSLVAKEGK